MAEENTTELVNLGPSLATLERRAKYLAKQLTDWKGGPTGRDFATAELEAIEVAIAGLKLHRAQLEGMAEPVGALRALVAAVDETLPVPGELQHVTIPHGVGNNITLRTALKRAKLALEEFAELEKPTN